MGRALSNKNVCDARFETAEFTGAWLDSFGRPELRGAWIIYGESGCGKTHFALMLMKYLARFVNRVAYDTLEQGLSLSFQNSWNDAEMQDVGASAIVLDKETIEDLRERLDKKRSPSIVIIDSITALVGFTRAVFTKLINDYPDKLFIFIAHEENGKPYPAVAQHVRKLSEVKIHVEGFKAFFTTRFKGENGEGQKPFVIWEQGATDYWADKL